MDRCDVCEAILIAFQRGDAVGYQRGREDAAKAVEALGSLRCYEVYEADDGYLAGSYYEVDAVAAARGDGGQA